MATYSISEVEALTGIQSHTLRVWERRYDLIKAKRTDTKIRYYDDSQLKLLLNVGILINNGHKISKLDKMSEVQISEHAFEILKQDDTSIESDVQGLVSAMLNMDEPLFNRIFGTYHRKHGLVRTILDLIYPFLYRVGLLWGAARAMPAQEHFVSNLIRMKIFHATNQLQESKSGAGSVVLFLPEGEHHEMGLLLANYIIRDLGYRTYYLGQNVPSDDVIKVDNEVDPAYLLAVIVLWREEYAHEIARISKETNSKMLLAGNIPNTSLDNSVLYLDSPNKIFEILGTNV